MPTRPSISVDLSANPVRGSRLEQSIDAGQRELVRELRLTRELESPSQPSEVTL